MALEIRKYNVLALELEDIVPELRIANGVLNDLDAKARPFDNIILPELVKMGLIKKGTSLKEFADEAGKFFPAVLQDKITIPENERFFVDVSSYGDGIPGKISEFGRIYKEMAKDGIDVLFVNTASTTDRARHCMNYLAENACAEFPALKDSTWIVTSALRYPMPPQFMNMLLSNCNGKLTDPVSRNLAVTTESRAYGIPFGDSIAIRGAQDAVDVIYQRLKYLRKDPTRHLKKIEGRTK